ncbi:hypothetical protein [Rhizobium sp. BE258]|jgi:hypothetical protein|nr:hypothetical protein [Rhizobium sp. BE258]MDR7146249.1 hypothetical protein [Rhizobium sp. BE258]
MPGVMDAPVSTGDVCLPVAEARVRPDWLPAQATMIWNKRMVS